MNLKKLIIKTNLSGSQASYISIQRNIRDMGYEYSVEQIRNEMESWPVPSLQQQIDAMKGLYQ